jgi:hydroxymethylpyrimidine/phosphomethylpyrimidine kinase
MAKALKPRPCVLTIAGSDSGGGAGIQTDARTVQALGGYALTAITAVTAQNGRGITAWRAVAPRLIAAQVQAVRAGFPVAAVKTGLLPGSAAIRAIAAVLRRHPRLPLVVDPVIGSTSGTRFLSTAALRELRRSLLPLATLLTPNRPEAEALVGPPRPAAPSSSRAATRPAGFAATAWLPRTGACAGSRARGSRRATPTAPAACSRRQSPSNWPAAKGWSRRSGKRAGFFSAACSATGGRTGARAPARPWRDSGRLQPAGVGAAWAAGAPGGSAAGSAGRSSPRSPIHSRSRAGQLETGRGRSRMPKPWPPRL